MTEDYRKVADGSHCEVWLHKDAEKVLRKAPANDRARAGQILKHLSENGQDGLHDKQFKFEERFKSNHDRVAVYAVKAYQLRMLGGWVGEAPRKFVCPEAAIKKTDKADQDQLKRVAKKLGEYRGD